MNEKERVRRQAAFEAKQARLQDLFESALEMYSSRACPCAFPRYRRIVGIDCVKTGDSYRCFETELLIDLSRRIFHQEKSARKDENTNETWSCETCGSIFEYGWSDFSIAVDRQKLELSEAKTKDVGKSADFPIPLFMGLMGHSYPPRSRMVDVSFDEFENYMLER